jgi:AraC-like DNA-binding protein
LIVPTARGARKRPVDNVQHWLTGAFALQLLRLARRWNVSPAQLLKGLGAEAELAAPGATLPLEAVITLCERARALTGEPGLGLYWGLSQRATGYGYPGFAAMSAESYGQALQAIRYVPMITTMVSMHLEVQGDVASLMVEEHSDPRSARDILLIGLLVGLRQVGEDITGSRLLASIDLSISEPDYYREFANIVPRVRFGQPMNRLVFDTSALELPIVMADAAALRLASEQCERALEDLGPEAILLARVRRALLAHEGFRSLAQVAAELRLSPRTLMKMLVQRGTSFASLVDDERRKTALRLLVTSQLALDGVAARLGYSTVSNFVRAFHRWTGQTPAAYRRGAQRARP